MVQQLTFNASWNTSGINPNLTFFPELAYDSYLTINLSESSLTSKCLSQKRSFLPMVDATQEFVNGPGENFIVSDKWWCFGTGCSMKRAKLRRITRVTT